MTEREFQDALYARLRWDLRHDFIIPNYTPPTWGWECDMMSVTKAGLMHEYEIKLTRSDFKADAKKDNGVTGRWDKETRTWVKVAPTTKHAKLALGAENGPCRFFYVTPPGLVTPEEVPEFAGLLELHHDARSKILKTVKPAPKLHSKKLSEATIAHVGRVYAYRYWNIRLINKGVRDLPDPADIVDSPALPDVPGGRV